jgi:EmrB/QacA subfamily drug resistance transporter
VGIWRTLVARTIHQGEERLITDNAYITAGIAGECCHHVLSEADDYRPFRSARTGPDGHEIGPPNTGPVASPPIAYPRRWWALSVLCLGLLLIAFDTTVLNVALPAIARELHASTSALQWVVDSYTLALGCLQLVFGGLADNLGRRRLLLMGLAVFVAGSIWAAYSLSAGSLIAARALTGIGAAALLPCTLASVLFLFPDARERAKALGVWSGTVGLGIVAGPTIGGALLDHFWFGSIFLLNVPIVLVAFFLVLAVVPENRGPAMGRRLDTLGTGLAVFACVAVLWGLIEAPERGWLSAPVTTSVIAGLATAVVFAVWETRCQRPLLPRHLYRRRAFRMGTTAITVLFFAVYGLLFALTQDLQLRLGYGALAAGIRMLPAGIVLVSAGVAPALARRRGPAAVLGLGLTAVAAGLAVIGLAPARAGYVPIGLGLFLTGAGMGFTMPTAEDAVLASVELKDAGAGSGANSTHLQVGGSLGVALLGSILLTTYRHDLARLAGAPSAAVRAARPSLYAAVEATSRLSGCSRGPSFASARLYTCASAFLTGAGNAFGDGLRAALTAGAALCALGGALVMWAGRMRQPGDRSPEGAPAPAPGRTLDQVAMVDASNRATRTCQVLAEIEGAAHTT